MIEEAELESSSRIDCPVLVTERLVLRPPHADDIPELVELANSRRVADMLSRMPHPYGEAEARDFIARTAKRTDGCAYALTVADTGAFIGGAGLDPSPRGLEIGYWIGEPHWGMGYATEAAHALIDLAFRATEIELLNASCRVVNDASRRVIHKCGFQYVGQGMIDSLSAGRVPVERYVLDRKTWVSLRTWARTRA
ncbi:MAG: GNAT family N-acetyltransferase [Rhizobiaceae bacterium]|nr:GNAT family N-acetyltransferase [Rhizobiaceae bacterium]